MTINIFPNSNSEISMLLDHIMAYVVLELKCYFFSHYKPCSYEKQNCLEATIEFTGFYALCELCVTFRNLKMFEEVLIYFAVQLYQG